MGSGGGCGERGRNPDLVLSKCRSKDDAPLIHQQYRVDYLYTSMKRRVPIGLILGNSMSLQDESTGIDMWTGQGNVVCPTKIPHKYCVMDWFFVTHIWAEPCGGKLVHRFRLQKIDLATKSWWILKDSSDPASPFLRDYRTQIQVKTCANCGIPSPQIYKNNWFCTATHCPRFGKVWGGSLPRKLEFTDEFLQERAMYSPNCVMPRLQPFAISSVPVPQTAQQYFSRDAWRGRVCPICHGCMPRMIWEGYSCRTPNCGYFHEPELQIMPPKVCYGGLFNATIGHSWPDVRARIPGIVIERPGRKNHHWNIFEFDLSKGCTFAHLSSNLVENGRPGGSEDLFIALQRTRIGLSRRTMGGNSLTRHFAVNHGMHYKYHAHHGTTAFSQSPPVIHAALSQLQWAAKCVAGDEMDDINEVLTVAYFEDMKMNYHDDGESTVGNTIVSLSLGHAATMSFKMKDKIYNLHGLTKQNYDHTVPVIRGSKFWKEREGLNAEWVKLTNQAKSGRLNAIFKALEMDRKASPVLFEATLKFGDMMVMHGEAFQKIYDHAVIPQGGLRFALTGRHMKLSEFPKEEHWKGKIDIDPQYRYDPDHRHVRTIPEPEYHGPAAMPSPITTERASPQRQHPESPSNDFPGSGPQGSNDTSPSHSAGLLRTPESSGVAHSYDNAENASPISQSIHPPDTLDPQDVPDSFNPSKTTEISDLLVSSDVPNAIANAGPLNVSRCLSDSDLSEISERKMNDLESSVILANPDNLGGSVRMTTARKTLPKSRSEAQGSSIGMSGDDKDVDVHLEVNVSVEVPCAEPEFGDEQPMSSDH